MKKIDFAGLFGREIKLNPVHDRCAQDFFNEKPSYKIAARDTSHYVVSLAAFSRVLNIGRDFRNVRTAGTRSCHRHGRI